MLGRHSWSLGAVVALGIVLATAPLALGDQPVEDAEAPALGFAETGANGSPAASLEGASAADDKAAERLDLGDPDPGCLDHPPIHVEGDLEFLLPGSGVRGGLGLEEVPFVIEGWCINAELGTGDPEAAIHLENTTAHVVIRDNRAPDVGSFAHGIHLENAANVEVRANEIPDTSQTGIDLASANDVQAVENDVTSPGAHAIHVTDSEDVGLEANRLEAAASTAIQVEGGEDVRIEANDVRDGADQGVHLRKVVDSRIEGNEIAGNAGTGLHLFEPVNASVAANDLDANGKGLELRSADDATEIVGNTITDHPSAGIHVVRTTDVSVRDNDLADQPVSLQLGRSHAVDVTGNTFQGGGLAIGGSILDHFQHDVDDTNTVNGDTLRYVDEDGIRIDGDVGQVFAVGADGVTVADTAIEGTNLGVVAVHASNVTLENTTVANHTWKGVMFRFSEDVRVEDSRIAGNGKLGIRLDAGQRVAVVNNEIHDNGRRGIDLDRTDDLRIAANDIESHEIRGIAVSQDAQNVTIEDNRIEDTFTGIVTGPNTDTLVRHNTLNDTDRGVSFSFADGDRAVANTIANASRLGIHLDDGGVARDNLVESSSTGIVLRDRAEAHGNRVTGSTSQAIALRGDGSLAAGNEAENNGGDGLAVDGGSGNVVRDNLARGNGGIGIYLLWDSGTTVANNTVEANDDRGIRVSSSQGAHLKDNAIADTTSSGLYVYGSEDVLVEHNLVTNNWDGVTIGNSAQARLHANNITGNPGYGAVLYDLQDDQPIEDQVHRNNIDDNADDAFRVGGSRVDVTDNWWGHETGPSGGIEDACTGTLADGEGGSIYTFRGGSACFDPWLEQPNPDAGPR